MKKKILKVEHDLLESPLKILNFNYSHFFMQLIICKLKTVLMRFLILIPM